MNMKKLKSFAIILALFGFTGSIFAQPVSYTFSGFGGGLPSSAAKLSASDENTSQRIIIEDENEDDSDNDYDYYDEPKVSKKKNVALITTYVVLGVVVVAGVVFGTIYMTNESAKCCETTTDSLIQGCGEGCGESCSEACSQSMSEACSASMDEACSSSTSSSECSTTELTTLFTGGLNVLPVFIP